MRGGAVSYTSHGAPDHMSRDGWIALGVIVLACVGVYHCLTLWL